MLQRVSCLRASALAPSVARAYTTKEGVSPNRKARTFDKETTKEWTENKGEWFANSKTLTELRKKPQLHFVFLEGPAGSAKASILERLEKIGYTTFSLPFTNFYQENSQYPVDSALVSHRWVDRILAQMHQHSLNSKIGRPYRDNVVFYHRSALSPAIYAKEGSVKEKYYLDLHAEIQKMYNTSVLLCHTEKKIKVEPTVTPQAAEMLSSLGMLDAEHEKRVMTRYLQWKDKGYINEILQTTSDKQAVAFLMHLYGIDTKFNFAKREATQ